MSSTTLLSAVLLLSVQMGMANNTVLSGYLDSTSFQCCRDVVDLWNPECPATHRHNCTGANETCRFRLTEQVDADGHVILSEFNFSGCFNHSGPLRCANHSCQCGLNDEFDVCQPVHFEMNMRRGYVFCPIPTNSSVEDCVDHNSSPCVYEHNRTDETFQLRTGCHSNDSAYQHDLNRTLPYCQHANDVFSICFCNGLDCIRPKLISLNSSLITTIQPIKSTTTKMPSTTTTADRQVLSQSSTKQPEKGDPANKVSSQSQQPVVNSTKSILTTSTSASSPLSESLPVDNGNANKNCSDCPNEDALLGSMVVVSFITLPLAVFAGVQICRLQPQQKEIRPKLKRLSLGQPTFPIGDTTRDISNLTTDGSKKPSVVGSNFSTKTAPQTVAGGSFVEQTQVDH